MNYETSDTPLAAYLIQSGRPLIEIVYELKSSGKRQATFVFDDVPELQNYVSLFTQGKAIINLALYEHTKSNLIDRLMRGQP